LKISGALGWWGENPVRHPDEQFNFPPQGDINKLHSAIRKSVKAICDKLHKEGHMFEVFEAFRTPERQAFLFAQGRTRPGNKVTWVNSWRSIHQYGLAVDFILKIDGKWSWDTTGQNAKRWTRMHEIAKEHGMTPLFNSKGKLIELPHIQLIGVSSTAMHRGEYPEGGDMIWAQQQVI
jgi:peptidoglycan L-alanyl-D-glutamate endopeptidase CwlK